MVQRLRHRMSWDSGEESVGASDESADPDGDEGLDSGRARRPE
jgi:hypothetical protein